MNALQPEAPFRLVKVDFAERAAEISALRIRAWEHELGIDPAYFEHAFIEPVDETAHHWVITQPDGSAVAAARLSLHHDFAAVPYAELLPRHFWPRFRGKTVASFSRMVIDPQFRGHHFSTLLDRVRFERANATGVDFIVGATQLGFRRTALTRLGFEFVCELLGAPERPDWPLHFMLYEAALHPINHVLSANHL